MIYACKDGEEVSIPYLNQPMCVLFILRACGQHTYTPGASNIAVAGKWGPRIESMYLFPIKNGDIPASYVSLLA